MTSTTGGASDRPGRRPAARHRLRRGTALRDRVRNTPRYEGVAYDLDVCSCRDESAPIARSTLAHDDHLIDSELLRGGCEHVAKPHVSSFERLKSRKRPDGDGSALQPVDELDAGLRRKAPAERRTWSDGGDPLEAGGHAELDGAGEVPPAEPVVRDEQV